jgi:hypothetical protein
MKTREVLHRFAAKDGREVILRIPRWEDLDDILELINSLVDESAEIPNKRKLTKEVKASHLRSRLIRWRRVKHLNWSLRLMGK